MIYISSKPKKIGLFEETIVTHISECEAAYRKGIPMLLNAVGVGSKFNFNNIRDIFYNQCVVNSITDFNCPEQVIGAKYEIEDIHSCFLLDW